MLMDQRSLCFDDWSISKSKYTKNDWNLTKFAYKKVIIYYQHLIIHFYSSLYHSNIIVPCWTAIAPTFDKIIDTWGLFITNVFYTTVWKNRVYPTTVGSMMINDLADSDSF